MMAGLNEAPAPCHHQNTNCRMMPARRRNTLALTWPLNEKDRRSRLRKLDVTTKRNRMTREPLTASLTNKVNRPDREPGVEWRRGIRMPGGAGSNPRLGPVEREVRLSTGLVLRHVPTR